MCTFLWISFIDGPLWAAIRRPPPPSCHKMSNNGALPHLFPGRNGFSLPRASMPWARSGRDQSRDPNDQADQVLN